MGPDGRYRVVGPFHAATGCVYSNSSRFYVHPFREGNTRTQFAFFRQLSAEAGYTLDTDRFQAVDKAELRSNPLIGDLREQFVWGRFEYMQTGDTRLMRDVLDQAIIDTDPLPIGPFIDHGVDLRAIAAAVSGHPRCTRNFALNTSTPDPVATPVDLSRNRHMSHDLHL